MSVAGCKGEDPAPTSAEQGNGTSVWPEKKISRIVYSIGTFDYLTFDFDWEDGCLSDIRSTYYDGSLRSTTKLEYDQANRLKRVYPCDGSGVAYEAGAINYFYDASGRIEKQTLLLPVRQIGEHQFEADSCELLFHYSGDNRVSEVVVSRIVSDDSIAVSHYCFDWTGGNVTSIRLLTDGNERVIMSDMQYDSYPNPLRFPMGLETMGTDLNFEGVLGDAVLFLGYACCWCENNMTTLLSGSGQVSMTYDDDGYVLTKTITAGGQSSTYTFSYCE